MNGEVAESEREEQDWKEREKERGKNRSKEKKIHKECNRKTAGSNEFGFHS